jgi:hypothetical protein
LKFDRNEAGAKRCVKLVEDYMLSEDSVSVCADILIQPENDGK